MANTQPRGIDMLTDRLGGEHSSHNAQAVAHLAEATLRLAAHKSDLIRPVETALALDPGLVAARALHGFFHILSARASDLSIAQATSRALSRKQSGTAFEIALCEALHWAAHGNWIAAADRLDAHRQHAPVLLFFKLSYALRFMAGDQRGMLATTEQAMRTWNDTDPGYGYVAGCHAFTLGETGRHDAAIQFAQRAIAQAPDDVWAMHAIAHALDTTGQARNGIAWLEQTRQSWNHAGNFRFHLNWHLALMHLSLGDTQRVLALYDQDIYPDPSSDFRDLANAISLLCRLKQEGVDIGTRLVALRDGTRQRINDTTLVFASLHDLLALLACGDMNGAAQLVEALRDKAQARGDQGLVADQVGIAFAETLLRARREGCIDLQRIGFADRLATLGGSHAQRDIFLRSLIVAAVDAGQSGLAQKWLTLRARLRSQDVFAHRMMIKIAQFDQRAVA